MIRKQYFFHIHSLGCNTPIQFSFLQCWDICAAAEIIMLSLLCEDSYAIKILQKNGSFKNFTTLPGGIPVVVDFKNTRFCICPTSYLRTHRKPNLGRYANQPPLYLYANQPPLEGVHRSCVRWAGKRTIFKQVYNVL